MNYESVLVMEPALTGEAQKRFFQKVKKVIVSDFKGNIHHIDTWGSRKLANKNRKNRGQGLYFHFSFKGEKGVVEELSRIIKMEEDVLYHHFERLARSPEEHLADFRTLIEEAVKKEKERQLRLQKRKSFLSKRPGA